MDNTYKKYCQLRDSRGLKDSHVAAAAGITKSTFSDWKTGRSIPKIDKLMRIAKVLGVSLECFAPLNEIQNTSQQHSESYKRFEELLEKHTVTAYRVSKETGISTATLTSWKQGVYTPKREKLKVIADYFSVPLEYLTDGDDALLLKEPLSEGRKMYERYERLLSEHGVTTYQVCKATGISQSTIGGWKARGNLLRADKALLIADYFGVTLDYLTTGKEKTATKDVIPHQNSNDIAKRFEQMITDLQNPDKKMYYQGEELNEDERKYMVQCVQFCAFAMKGFCEL